MHDKHPHPIVLFTAFEPSGDAHAAPIIQELKKQWPEVEIYAWGGPKMEAAGAKLIENTVEDAAMGLGAFSRIRAVKKQIKNIKKWSKKVRVIAHVPVDSPAANFPICKILRRRGTRTIHLVAPQLWAWGSWRVGKLRRRTDLVLCLLPFEEEWFKKRRIPAKFIGHPAINRKLDDTELHDAAAMMPRGAPKVAIFPGSRFHEAKKNIGLLMSVYKELQSRHSEVCGVIVAANRKIGKMIDKKFDVLPTGIHIVFLDPDAAICWCDCALAVSGTITLNITRQTKPMIGVYRVNIISKIISMLLLRTKYRLLPNILAGKKIAPEFVPYAGGPMRVVMAVTPYLHDSKICAVQSQELNHVCQQFKGKNPGVEGAALIASIIHNQPITD